jgi:hypothetical protein
LGDLGFCKIAPKISANKDGIKANGGTMNIKLTPNETQIFHQLQQAAWTLQSLPADLQSRPARLRSAWPEMCRKTMLIYGQTRRNMGPRPSLKAIDEMNEMLDVLARMAPCERRLISARANGVRWLRLVHFTGRSRTSLHRDLKLALGKFVRIRGRNSLM